MGPRALPLLEPGRRPQPAKWYRLSPRGDRPRGRVGHGCLFLPGGGPGRVLLLGGADPAGAFADAHFVELGAHRWAAAGWRGLRPRYEHATFLPAAAPPRLWVFGGAHPAGNRSCVQVLDLEKQQWTLLQFDSPLPAGRLDHAMCVIPWRASRNGDTGAVAWEDKAGKESSVSAGDEAGPLQNSQDEERAEDAVVHLLLIFGGMDTQGEIYRDCVVSLID